MDQPIPDVKPMNEKQLRSVTKKQLAQKLADAQTRLLHADQVHENLMNDLDRSQSDLEKAQGLVEVLNQELRKKEGRISTLDRRLGIMIDNL
jgi:chromosome segregation ATPase